MNYHTPIVKFGITYRNNYLLDDINLDRSILNTNLAFKVGNHELGGFLGYNIFRNTINERDFYATATYRYTMGMPIAKRKDIGNLSGAILRSDGSPAAGIVLKVGRQTVVTESDGSFVFENLRKGDHFLLADISSLGLKEMFQQKMPYQFTIAPAEQKQIRLNLITAAGLTMPVTYQLGPRVQKPVGLVVRLRNDSEEFITDLSPQEAFEFLKVNPGLWTYQVVQNGWEQKYSIRPSSGTIELKEGEQLEIPIFVREKELQIKFKN